jgi:chromate transporter
MTEGQLLDAIAVGQFTPGPVFTTATFVGWVTRGPWGALIATIGIFLPAFILVSVSGPLITRIRRSRTAGAFLDGVNVATVALMVVVSWFLGRAAFVDISTVVIAVVSFGCLVSLRINSAWLVFAGGVLGTLIS